MSSRISLRLLLILTLVAALWIASPARPTHAATFTIPCGDTAALLAALSTANGTPEADTINLAAGCTYDYDGYFASFLSITTPITINGNGATLKLDPSPNSHTQTLFLVYGGSLTINDTMLHSRVPASGYATIIDNYGGTIVLNNSTLFNNYGVHVIDSTNGRLIINGCTFTNNEAYSLCVRAGTAAISNSTFANNAYEVLISSGGAAVTIADSTFSANTGPWTGAAVGVDSSTVTISGSTFSGNHATDYGGGVLYATNSTVTITSSTFSGNEANHGGAIYADSKARLTITDSVFSGNIAQHGAIYSDGAGSITGSCFLNNINTIADIVDVVNTSGSSLNAANNWWGSTSGPGVNAVSSNVITAPFLTALAPACGGVIPAAAATGPSAADHARAQASLCADVNGSTDSVVQADIPGGTVPNGSVYCRVITANGTYRPGSSAAQIGNADVIGRGVIQAVDVFGTAGASAVTTFIYPVKVCLQGSGVFLFLDALTSPRTLSQLPTTSEGGYTCATLPNAGTAVLVNP